MLRKQHWMKNLLQQEGVSLSDLESLEDSETKNVSQSETAGFFEEALEQTDRAATRRGTRAKNFPQFFGEVRTHLVVTECDLVEPKKVYEAMHGDNWDQLHRAMEGGVKALQDKETWNLVRPHTDRVVISGKWFYRAKLGLSGQMDRYNAGYVPKGFKQVEGLDYFETFAPTYLRLLRLPETFRILLQLSAKQSHLLSRRLSFTHKQKKKYIWNSHSSL